MMLANLHHHAHAAQNEGRRRRQDAAPIFLSPSLALRINTMERTSWEPEVCHLHSSCGAGESAYIIIASVVVIIIVAQIAERDQREEEEASGARNLRKENIEGARSARLSRLDGCSVRAGGAASARPLVSWNHRPVGVERSQFLASSSSSSSSPFLMLLFVRCSSISAEEQHSLALIYQLFSLSSWTRDELTCSSSS